MGYLKKIYTVLIIITLCCGGLLILNIFNVINIDIENKLILKLFTLIPVVYVFCGLVSRNAIVAANKSNFDLANGLLLFYLICFLLIIFTLFFDIIELPEIVTNIIIYSFVFFTSLMLIYEVPASHDIHIIFQKFMVILTIVSLVLGISYISKLKGISDYTSYESYLNTLEDIKIHGNFFVSSLLLFGTSFMINPMLRVIFFDESESSLSSNSNIFNQSFQNSNINPQKTTVNNNIISNQNPNLNQTNTVKTQTVQQPIVQQTVTQQTAVQPVIEADQNIEVPSLDQFNNQSM